MSKFKFTEEYIQDVLNRFFAISTPKYIMENLYVFRWESDKLIETRSGLIYEFEVKVSRSDFFNDFNKKDKHFVLEGKTGTVPSYDDVKARYWFVNDDNYRTDKYKRPNYFYYAVPEGLVKEEEVPDYAGLIYILPEDQDRKADGSWCGEGFYVVKKAPKLHDTKYTDDELALGEKFYYNMLSWKDKYREERRKWKAAEMKDQKLSYGDLLDKYEKEKKEKKALAVLAETESKTKLLFAETMENDRHIINAYRAKIKELDPEFNWIHFEDEILEQYGD